MRFKRKLLMVGAWPENIGKTRADARRIKRDMADKPERRFAPVLRRPVPRRRRTACQRPRNSAAPTSVTVGGNTYTLGTSAASFAVSTQGGFTNGDIVSLLLGMNAEVVDVVSATEINATYYGMITAIEKVVSNSGSNTTGLRTQYTVACTDGVERTFYSETYTAAVGRVVSVTFGADGVSVTNLQTKPLEGDVDEAGTKLGKYAFAEDIEIMEVDGEGNYKKIYPSRIAGASLERDTIVYYRLNQMGEIDRLILQNATGDAMQYVYITGANYTYTESGDVDTKTYNYYLNGVKYTTGVAHYTVNVGGGIAIYDDGVLQQLKALTKADITAINGMTAVAGNETFGISEDVQVFIGGNENISGTYPASLSDINSNDYMITGWYDEDYAAGGKIRILFAVEKE